MLVAVFVLLVVFINVVFLSYMFVSPLIWNEVGKTAHSFLKYRNALRAEQTGHSTSFIRPRTTLIEDAQSLFSTCLLPHFPAAFIFNMK